ncbi:GNAT family N-acetyltransferase [Actinomadura barringtoniae]|uniref:GNAT family N-acetyltransferase n=1 Tax=Actinomadura barringtoniae TaxID=1427535 RepID=A0A939T6H7_9ACTN|nr:GNAT family N-acetyltransferase [Actinomadura barringtoniae]MBO2450849.1 GNAT family N-acetyltransferase [Actinomadura barringtoniae]
MTQPITPIVRPAMGHDVSSMAVALARAFYSDPLFVWMLPDAATRKARNAILFDILARHAHLGHGGVEVAECGTSILSAALWDPPGRWRLPLRAQLAQAPAFRRAFGTRLPAALAVLTAVQWHHPAEPHWYLGVLGTEPAAQGQGLAGALLRSRLDRCDTDGVPAYLETSNEPNIAYYAKFGFRVTKEISLPRSCPPIWLMWRDPQ